MRREINHERIQNQQLNLMRKKRLQMEYKVILVENMLRKDQKKAQLQEKMLELTQQ